MSYYYSYLDSPYYSYSRYYDWPSWRYSAAYDWPSWRYSSAYDWPYSRYYSRYLDPLPLPTTKSVSYETVRKETTYSPYTGVSTVTTKLWNLRRFWFLMNVQSNWDHNEHHLRLRSCTNQTTSHDFTPRSGIIQFLNVSKVHSSFIGGHLKMIDILWQHSIFLYFNKIQISKLDFQYNVLLIYLEFNSILLYFTKSWNLF